MRTNQLRQSFGQSVLFVTSFVLSSFTVQLHADENWSYTYNSLGLIETSDGPRSDVIDVTSYTYDAAGNRTTVTNALGQVTQYLDYDARGNAGRMIDANGVETLLTYHPRGWLATSTVKHPLDSNLDARTSYSYEAVSGLISQIILSNGTKLNFEYDAARRMTAVSNNMGERIDYTLDAAGNQMQEVTSDNGNITQVVTRAFDELSRLMDLTGNNGQNTHHDYDLNDNKIATTDGNLNTINQSFDALNRVETITQADNTDIDFLYDDQDRVEGVVDPRGVATTFTYDAYDNILTEVSADRGTITYTYDDANNRTSQTDARGVKSTYSYDELNRLLTVVFNDNAQHPENISYHYDDQTNENYGVGKLTGYSDESGSTFLKYNHLGQLIEKTYSINGNSYTQEWTYDSAGNITSETYPLGRVIEYELDALGRVTSVSMKQDASSSAESLINNVTYQPFGGVKSFDYANGISVTYEYDLDGRVSSIQATGLTPVQDKIYTYDLADNIVAIEDQLNVNFDQFFGVDELNRIESESGSYGNRDYVYDDSSNRVQHIINKAKHLYYESDSNQLTGFWNGGVVTRDESGNRLSFEKGNGNAKYYEYNAQGRLSDFWKNTDTTIPRKQYQYNALGQRVYDKDAEKADKDLHYNLIGQYVGQYYFNVNPNQHRKTIEWVYLAGMPVVQIVAKFKANGTKKSEEITYIHNDHLVTPRLMTDQNQVVVWRWDSEAFGNGGINKDPDGDGVKYNLDLRFPGQIKDSYSGLYYNYFRDYDPSLGRYIQSDPIGLAGGLNAYNYVGASPLNYMDPLGLYWFRQWWQKSGQVGRPDTIVEPRGEISEFIETNIPAGYTFGELHDEFVDYMTEKGYPDKLVNIPTMPLLYNVAVLIEILRSLEYMEQPEFKMVHCE